MRTLACCSLVFAAACGGEGETSATTLASTMGAESTVGESSLMTSTSSAPATDSADASSGGSSMPNACMLGPSPGVALGHGDQQFLPFESGPAQLVYGAQGGFHILVGLQAWGLDTSDVAVARLRGVIDGEELGSSAPYADFDCTPEGDAQQALGLFLIWDASPEMLHMQTAIIEVELTDAAGTIVSASAETLIYDPNQE